MKPPTVRWSIFGGVTTLLALVAYIGWRLEQATNSLVAIAEVVKGADKP